MAPQVSIIILNWNGWKDTIECLESLYQINYPNYEVILIDNNSEDSSLEKIKEYCEGKLGVKSKFFQYDPKNKPIKIFGCTKKKNNNSKLNSEFEKRINLIKNHENYGFAEGNNIGIRYALKNFNSDFILLLNNDTVVNKNFLNELVKNALTDEKIGFTGPKTYYYDYDGKTNIINFAGGKFNIWKGKSQHIGINEVDEGQYDDIKEVDYIEGSCCLIKKDLMRKLNSLNPHLFGWEEIEMSLKAKKMGYKSLYIPNAMIWHKIGSSMGGNFCHFHLYYYIRSGLIVMAKNARWFHKIIFTPFFIRDIIIKILIIFYRDKNIRSIFYSIKIVFKAFLDFRKINSKDLNFESFFDQLKVF